ncbi:MAG: TetR/AcrR family transcriptional regulator [Bacteroidales bacterium]|jgi:AcrR family transcriptional regulator|nr:TetR/AcrR family transcriptional regulator [Bacteroidales bacterium]MDD4385323.1 TetR/AcrR family transcriptional regulator [Bacteroidales bacterium]MDY0198269.1 TetR/AcrR family transcriptional regulator [Tenuifilaceae bacterium]
MSKGSIKTKQKILDSATELFLKKGVDRVGVREIAAKAGINLSLMNYYFQTKEKLFETIFDMLVKDKAEHLRDILESNLPIEEKISDYIDSYIDILIDKPILVSFVMSVIHRNPEKLKTMGSVLALYNSEKFCNHINIEAQAGRVRSVNPEQLYVSIISLILFPFAIKELIADRNKFTPKEYDDFVITRKTHITDMVLSYLKV